MVRVYIWGVSCKYFICDALQQANRRLYTMLTVSKTLGVNTLTVYHADKAGYSSPVCFHLHDKFYSSGESVPDVFS